MKKKTLEVCRLAHNAPQFLALFERMILRRKTLFLGPLKFSKNMLRKSILIGLFVLNNNRTIGEQNVFREGRKGNCPHVHFYGWLWPAQAFGGGFSHSWLRWLRRQWFKVAPYSFSTVCEVIFESFQTLCKSRARDHALKCRQTCCPDFQNVFLVRVAWIGSGFKTFIERIEDPT